MHATNNQTFHSHGLRPLEGFSPDKRSPDDDLAGMIRSQLAGLQRLLRACRHHHKGSPSLSSNPEDPLDKGAGSFDPDALAGDDFYHTAIHITEQIQTARRFT